MSRFSNQPMCTACWFMREPDRTPVRVKDSELMQCSSCGNPTYSGIFVRRETALVNYPRVEVVNE